MRLTSTESNFAGEDGSHGAGRAASVPRVVDLGAEVLRQERRKVEGAIPEQLSEKKRDKCRIVEWLRLVNNPPALLPLFQTLILCFPTSFRLSEGKNVCSNILGKVSKFTKLR